MSDFRKYLGPHWPWKNNLNTFPAVLWGAILYLRLMKRRGSTHYLVMTLGMGDNLCALSYLREYKRKKGYPHVTLVGYPPAFRQICGMYEDAADAVLYLKQREILALQYFSRSLIGQNFISYSHRDRITFSYYHSYISQRLIWDSDDFYLADFFKTMLYQIGPEARPERPHIAPVEIDRFINEYKLVKGKTVFLNPVAKSVRLDTARLFQMLAGALQQRGFLVVTLTANREQKPVEGTAAVICDLNEAFRLIEYGGTVIGLRSGFLDLMAFANSKVVSVVDAEYGRRNFYKLKRLGTDADCYDITYESDQVTCGKILELVKQPV